MKEEIYRKVSRLLGTAFNIAYWHRKYHSGTICKGVRNPQSSKALSVCEKEEKDKSKNSSKDQQKIENEDNKDEEF